MVATATAEGEGEAPKNFGEIITFYSYKGGTGRSMVLANVAYLLAKQPSANNKRILAIDWDLEAPGLHRYFQKEVGAAAENKPGLIDLFCGVRSIYQDRVKKGDALPERTAGSKQSAELFGDVMSAHPLERYCIVPKGLDRLDLMTAGAQDPDYANRVRQFDWEGFYLSYGSFFTHLRELLMQKYDYVLIDSRTGITDTSGICTRVMPEKLVTVFAPNRQNIDGVVDAIRRAARYRLNARDARGLTVFPLASRLDASASRLRDLWWHGGRSDDSRIVGYQATFESLFREIYDLEECDLEAHFAATQVPHDSDYAYGEKIAVSEHSTDRLSIGYAIANLTTRLTQLSEPWEHLPDEDAAAAKKKAVEAQRAADEQLHKSKRETTLARRARLASVLSMGVAVAVLIGFGLRDGLKAFDHAPSAETLVADATKRRQAGDPNGALVLVDQALAKDARFFPAYVVRVEALLQKGDVKGAQLAFHVIPDGANVEVVKYLDDSIKKASASVVPPPPPPVDFRQMPGLELGGSRTGRAALEAAIGELGKDLHAELGNGTAWAASFVLWCLEQAHWKTTGTKPHNTQGLIDHANARRLFHPVWEGYQARPGDLVFPIHGVRVIGGKEVPGSYVAIVHHADGPKVWAIAGTVVDPKRGDNIPRVMGEVYQVPQDVEGFAEIRDPPAGAKE